MAWIDRRQKSARQASFPMDCPECGRVTRHAYGVMHEDVTFLLVPLPFGRRWFYVQCMACGEIRRVPDQDRTAIDALIKRSGVQRGHAVVATSLGHISVEPGEVRRSPSRGAPRWLVPVLLAVGLLLCAAAGYNFYQIVAETDADQLLVEGWMAYQEGHYAKALTRAEKARHLFQAADSRVKEATSLILIGHCRFERRDFRGALDAYEQSLPVWNEINDRRMVGVALANMGVSYESLGRCQSALRAYEEALYVFQELGERDLARQIEKRIDRLQGDEQPLPDPQREVRQPDLG